ncbi:GldG family protein [Haloferula rosea]|uniref:Gldg family protein n=1 Tax=Haloferula rosea TaxID=490093 RepID=A0A934RCB6_9BACT|nr:GldG family protein [Haloferula rosea]MBK1826391.1 Gldg family protein [Haloferula rosea]
MSQEGKSIHPVGRAILAIAALLIIVISGNVLVAKLGIGHKTLDLTEDKIHSLSDGTKSILDELAAPVVVRYYATRSTNYLPEEMKLHMRRVDDLLAEYESLSDGKLQIENLDPEPDTDAEDAANLDGISGQSINQENLYFGLAISCLDRTSTIPFLDPNDETMLEYEISRRIAEVSAARKPLIGVMSALDLGGGPAAMPGTRPTQPWVIYNQLQQSYEVEDLTMTPAEIDPEKYSMVLLIHPAGITPEAEFALDQYILQGGTVMACIDPFSVAAQMTGGGNPMMGQPGLPTSSDLPKLMEAWGVEMATNQVVGDGRYQTNMQGGRPGLAVLTVPQEGMPQEDSIVTRDLSSVTLFLPGGMIKKGGSGVEMDSLITSSPESGLVDNMPASRLDPSLITTFRPDGKTYDLALHLHGTFKTAFPDGDPAAATEEEAEEEQGDEAPVATGGDESENVGEETTKEEPAAAESLKEGTKPGNVFLIADVDAFYDNFAYQVQRLGNMQLAQPINGNSSLFFNLIDQAASSTHLIGSRSRAATSRPFTVFREMEADANQRVGAKIVEFEEKAQEAQQRINELQSQKSQGDQLYLTPEQEEELRKFRAEEVDARKQIRELRKDLRRDKDAIAGTIIKYNIAGVPTIIILIGLGLFAARRARTRAR